MLNRGSKRRLPQFRECGKPIPGQGRTAVGGAVPSAPGRPARTTELHDDDHDLEPSYEAHAGFARLSVYADRARAGCGGDECHDSSQFPTIA